MKKFSDMSQEDKEQLAQDAIDWAMNLHASCDSPLSDMEQFVEWLNEDGQAFEDEDALVEYLEERAHH